MKITDNRKKTNVKMWDYPNGTVVEYGCVGYSKTNIGIIAYDLDSDSTVVYDIGDNCCCKCDDSFFVVQVLNAELIIND